MQRIRRFGMVICLSIAVVFMFAGCAKKSPLEQLIENRSRYSAEINPGGFYVDAAPLVMDVAEAAAEPQGEPVAEGEIEGEEPEPAGVIQTAYLDILLKHDSQVKLPGITVDVVHVDADLNEKGRWLVWLDTSNVERANPTQYSHVIEGIDYVEGDSFTAEVRRPIPEAERGDYREFANFGS